MSKRRKETFYICLTCACEAHMELDPIPGEEAAAWMLVNRFVNAHVKCDYVTPALGQTQSSAPDQWPGALS
jgi:hypothetical protein